MRWVSEKHEFRGHPYQIEGWHLETEQDYDRLIRCKRCGTETLIRQCKREPVKGYSGDVVAAPIYELSCPHCPGWLGSLDESDPKYTVGPVPFLTLDHDGELCS
ncbi:hypothetical protein KKD80_01065 [Patescibacteria group bacterium]|nr:hypothetical protein [Patescibacteria group bacterium]